MKWWIVVAAVVAACQSNGDRPGSAAGSAVGSAGGSAADPWAKPAAGSADDLPTLGERAAVANQACPKVDQPWFFEVKKGGRTSHLLGTRHIGVGLDKFPDRVRETFDGSTLAIFEVSPADNTRPTFKPEPLRDELGPEDWAHLEALVGKTAARRFVHVAPVVATISIGAMYEDLGVMLDKQLEQRAVDHHIVTGGLETSAFQLDLLGKWLDLRLLKTILESTPDRAKIKQESTKALARYCEGAEHDPDLMEGLDTGALERHGYTKRDLDQLERSLIDDRNADWIPKLEKLFEQDRVFVAVGAAHLQGPHGVVALLKRRGYAIARIPN
ncbi:MAG: TraB/GumN family protein [Kofleriaceae bacterium]